MQKENVIANLLWKLAERGGSQGINFVVAIILARVLSPEEYGTIALITVFIAILEVFVYGGFPNALIQKKDADILDFSTVFYFIMFACTGLYVLLYFAAPLIAAFYENMQLVSLVRVLGLKLIIIGPMSIQNAYVTRNMQFKKFFYSTLTGSIVSAFVGIWMVYNGFGVWSLIGQTLTAAAVNTIVLWVTVEFRPKWMFSSTRLGRLFSYGWKVLISNLLDTVYLNLRNLVIGKVYSAADLAYYNKADQFPKFIITNLNTSIDNVLFPVMSKAQDDLAQLKTITRKSIKTSAYFIWPCMIGLFVVAEPLVEILLTEKWLPSVPYLRVFCIAYAFYPLQTANSNAIKALGRSDVFLKNQIIGKTLGVLSIVVVINQGTFAIAVASMVVAALESVVKAMPNKRFIAYSYREQLQDIFPSIALASFMGFCVWWIQYLSLPVIIILGLQICTGILVYFVLSAILKFEEFKLILSVIKKLRR